MSIDSMKIEEHPTVKLSSSTHFKVEYSLRLCRTLRAHRQERHDEQRIYK